MRPRATVIAALAVAFVLPASRADAETRPRYGRTLKASLLGEPNALDPHKARSHAELMIADLLFDGLYSVNEDGSIASELATDLPTLAPNKLDATICIRVGAAFHDGGKLTVADVVASIKRLSAGPAGWLVASVSGVEAGSGDAQGCAVLRLRYPEPELARHLASPVAAITKRGKEPRGRRLNGTGPFRIRKLDRTRGEIRLRAFNSHHRGRAYLESLRLRWYKSIGDEARAYELGDIHVSARGAVAFSGHRPKYQTSSAAGPATILSYVGFGRAKPKLLADLNFRRALSLALRRIGMRNHGTGERVEPTVSPVARALGAKAPRASSLEAQLPAARAALDIAARTHRSLRRPGGMRLEILVDRTRLDDRDAADKVLAALHKLGLTASVVEVTSSTFAKRVARGACDLYIGQLATPTGTARGQLAAAFAAGRDSWAHTALRRAPLDPASARSEFRRRLPVVPLFHRAVRVHHRNDVLGLTFDGSAQVRWADLFLFGAAKRNP